MKGGVWCGEICPSAHFGVLATIEKKKRKQKKKGCGTAVPSSGSLVGPRPRLRPEQGTHLDVVDEKVGVGGVGGVRGRADVVDTGGLNLGQGNVLARGALQKSGRGVGRPGGGSQGGDEKAGGHQGAANASLGPHAWLGLLISLLGCRLCKKSKKWDTNYYNPTIVGALSFVLRCHV